MSCIRFGTASSSKIPLIVFCKYKSLAPQNWNIFCFRLTRASYRIFTFILTLLIGHIHCEVFTALADLEDLLDTEAVLIQSLENYIRAEEDKISILKRYVLCIYIYNLMFLFQYWIEKYQGFYLISRCLIIEKHNQ